MSKISVYYLAYLQKKMYECRSVREKILKVNILLFNV